MVPVPFTVATAYWLRPIRTIPFLSATGSSSWITPFGETGCSVMTTVPDETSTLAGRTKYGVCSKKPRSVRTSLPGIRAWVPLKSSVKFPLWLSYTCSETHWKLVSFRARGRFVPPTMRAVRTR